MYNVRYNTVCYLMNQRLLFLESTYKNKYVNGRKKLEGITIIQVNAHKYINLIRNQNVHWKKEMNY